MFTFLCYLLPIHDCHISQSDAIFFRFSFCCSCLKKKKPQLGLQTNTQLTTLCAFAKMAFEMIWFSCAFFSLKRKHFRIVNKTGVISKERNTFTQRENKPVGLCAEKLSRKRVKATEKQNSIIQKSISKSSEFDWGVQFLRYWINCLSIAEFRVSL